MDEGERIEGILNAYREDIFARSPKSLAAW